MIKDMTSGSPAKTIIFFALPMVMGNLFQQFYNVVDSIVVGNFVGESALAAVGAAFPIVFLLVAVAMGLTMGCSVLISQYFGAARLSDLRRAVFTCMIFLGVLSFVLTGIGIAISGPFLRLLNTPEEIMADAQTYLCIFFGGLFFLFVYNASSALFRSLGDSKTPLYFLVLATILNIFLDLFFVIVLKKGVAGVAWATLIAQAVSAVLCVAYIAKKVKILHFEKHDRVFDISMLTKMLTLGVPSTIQQVVVSLGMIFVQGLVNSFGKTVIAGFAACGKIDSIATMPLLNMSMALSTFTAQNMGAGNVERVKQGYRVTLITSFLLCVVISSAIFLFGSSLMRLFVDETASSGVIEFGVNYLQIVSLFYVLFSVMSTANGVLRGSGDMTAFMINTVISLACRVAACYALVHFIGVAGLWWGIPVGWVVGTVMANGRYLSGSWKAKVSIKNNNLYVSSKM